MACPLRRKRSDADQQHQAVRAGVHDAVAHVGWRPDDHALAGSPALVAYHELALASRERYQAKLAAAGYGAITTEIRDAPEFYFAEDYHQQYLAKNPYGYCGLGGTGVACPVGTEVGA